MMKTCNSQVKPKVRNPISCSVQADTIASNAAPLLKCYKHTETCGRGITAYKHMSCVDKHHQQGVRGSAKSREGPVCSKPVTRRANDQDFLIGLVAHEAKDSLVCVS